jgi:hypothetical protein
MRHPFPVQRDILATSVPQLRRATTAKVIAHTRVTSRLGAHIGRPVDLDAQSDLIGVPEPVSVESVLADQIGGSARVLPDRRCHLQ